MRSMYFGWLVVAASVLIYALIIGSTFASFGLFVLPVSEEFGLSRAEINTGLIILNLGNAAMAPFIGRLLDRVPARRVMATSAVLLGGSLIVLGLSHSLWLNTAVIALPVAIGVLGAGTISVSIMIARWFSVYRGRAMALAAIGMSVGGIVVTPIIGWLIEVEGWRTTLIVIGAAVGVLLFGLAICLRERPGPNDVEVRGAVAAKPSPTLPAQTDAPVAPPVSAMAILRMPLFWMLAIGIAMGSGVNQGLMISLVPLALESGLSTMESASLISVTGIAGIVSMLLLSVIADRWNRTILLAVLTLIGLVPCALLLVAESFPALLVTAVVIGLSLAVVAPVYIALLADRFGLAAFGTVRGLIVPVMSVMGALSVRFIGEIYDRTGDYHLGLWIYVMIDIAAAGLILATYRMHSAKNA